MTIFGLFNHRMPRSFIFEVTGQCNLECLHCYNALALGADGIMLNRFNPGGRGFANLGLLQASPGQLAGLLRQADDFAVEFSMGISCSVPIPPCLIDTSQFKHLSFGFCAAGTQRAYHTLDPMGNVRPCNHSKTILGNINETGLREMLGSQTMKRFKAARPPVLSRLPNRNDLPGQLQSSGGCLLW